MFGRYALFSVFLFLSPRRCSNLYSGCRGVLFLVCLFQTLYSLGGDDNMTAINALFGWLPPFFQGLFGGGLAIFVLWALFKLVSAIIKIVTDLIPGW